MPTGYAYAGGELSFSQPFFVPLWGLVGDIELEFVEEMISALTPTQYIAPSLIFFYLVFANIVLVNLLIATMTATYERVKNQSQLYWNFERTAAWSKWSHRLATTGSSDGTWRLGAALPTHRLSPRLTTKQAPR